MTTRSWPLSIAVGWPKVHAPGYSTVRFGGHVSAGAVVSTTVTVWEPELVLPQESVASQVRVVMKVLPQVEALVTVVSTVMVFVPSRPTLVGRSKSHAALNSTVLLLTQVM